LGIGACTIGLGVKIRKVKAKKGAATAAAAEKTKFKLRTSKYLYTFVSNDAETTTRVTDALPPSKKGAFDQINATALFAVTELSKKVKSKKPAKE
jgi:hypothetical protein